jgi:uncharacterized membrane protein
MRKVAVAAFVIGVGLGGLIDGVVFHQILQWHHMLSSTPGHPVNTVAGLEVNTLADGLFHLGTLLVLFAGITMLWRRSREGFDTSWRSLVGPLLAGWGAFDVVEGLIDHQLLGIHHVRDDLGGPLGWDLAFLALGALLTSAGLLAARER